MLTSWEAAGHFESFSNWQFLGEEAPSMPSMPSIASHCCIQAQECWMAPNKLTSSCLTVQPRAYDGCSDLTKHLALPLPNCSSSSTFQTQLHSISRSFFDDHRARREFHWFRCSRLGWRVGSQIAEACWIPPGIDELVTDDDNIENRIGNNIHDIHYDYAILLAMDDEK